MSWLQPLPTPNFLQLSTLLAYVQSTTQSSIFIKGEVRPYHMDDSGKPDSHLYSHSYIVTPSQNTVFRAANIVRKAILCLQTPDDCSAWTIFVHLFQFLQKLSMFHITLNRGG